MSLQPIPELREAWATANLAERHRRLRNAATAARERFLSSGQALAFHTCPIATFPYPTSFAFQGAALSPAPYVMVTSRMVVVQYVDHEGERRTLLFNPTDEERAEKAPFYATFKQRYGTILAERVLTKRHKTVGKHLEALGLSPDEVDYIAFDHLHLQDVRGWLGSYDDAAFFPRAKLLVQPAEWALAHEPHPMQAPWFVAGGCDGIDAARVVFLSGDTSLGAGVALLDTRGQTPGHMSLAVHTEKGVYVVSENGVATECYTPEASEIRGLARYAKNLGQEVILNGNTRESTPDQYASMVVEKLFAGPNADEPAFVNVYPSAELTASVMAPGLTPTFTHGELRIGTLETLEAIDAQA